jgi:ABC-2 type transport system permease protein
MRYYTDLYVNYWRLFVKALAQYRADLAITIGAAAVQEGATLLFIGIVFSNIRQLQGWTFAEVLMIWGLMTVTAGLWNVTLDVPHRIHSYIRSGELDYLMVRPPAILFQIAGSSGLNPTSLGRVLVGIVAIVAATREQAVAAAWWWALYLPAVVISGILLVFSLYLMIACLNFWFTNAESLLITFAWTAQLGRFPVTIFGPVLQFLLTWVTPFAMLGFYPVAFLLRGEDYRPYGLLALVIGWVFLGLALAVWRIAIRHYQSTGS